MPASNAGRASQGTARRPMTLIRRRGDQMKPSPRFRKRRLDEIAIELTSKCNLECAMCSVWKGKKDGLSAARITELLTEGRRLGATNFIPFGAEVFMRKDTVSIFEAAGELGYKTSVVTNGMLVPRHIQRLAGIANLTLGISIDGPEQVHDRLRGPGSYRAALEGVRAGREAGIPVSIKGVLMRPTIDTSAHLIDLAVEFGCDQVSLQPFQPE